MSDDGTHGLGAVFLAMFCLLFFGIPLLVRLVILKLTGDKVMANGWTVLIFAVLLIYFFKGGMS